MHGRRWGRASLRTARRPRDGKEVKIGIWLKVVFVVEDGGLDLADHDEDEQAILGQLGAWRAVQIGGKSLSPANLPEVPVDWQAALLLKKGKGMTKQTFPAHVPAAPANKNKENNGCWRGDPCGRRMPANSEKQHVGSH